MERRNMITISEYAAILGQLQEIVHEQTAGLIADELLIQPRHGGNCMAWVLGHLANNLVTIQQKVLGGQLPAGLPDFSRFGYGSEPVLGKEAGLPSLAEFVDSIDRLHAAITAQLKSMREEDFDQEIPVIHERMQRRGCWALFFFFHHSYHTGQLEFGRNLAGHTEHII
jgi:hypothetical protein